MNLFLLLAAIIVISACVWAIFNMMKKDERPIRFRRMVDGGNTLVEINAIRDIDQLALKSGSGNDELKFVRKDIKKGQKVEFSYPHSTEHATITVEVSGCAQVFEV